MTRKILSETSRSQIDLQQKINDSFLEIREEWEQFIQNYSDIDGTDV